MQKIVSVCVFLYVLTHTLVFVLPRSVVQAQESSSSPEYILPYAGMLPDNPLYKLKTLRDKVALMIISSPAQKTRKHIALADRMFIEALKLAEKGKKELAVHTAFKAEHHMTLAVSRVATIESPEQFDEIKETMLLASPAHRDILVGIGDRVKDDNEAANKIETLIQFSHENDDSVMKIVQDRRQQELFKELLQDSP